MDYLSTRGNAPRLNFEEAVLTGLAADGGLYLPASLPHFTHEELESMAALPYAELAYRILQPFCDGALPDAALADILHASYHDFRHEAIAPLVQIGANDWILELFHGPTLAFKDFALQFLGHLMSHLLQKRGEKVVVLGATSGDTGSAAIAGCRGLPNMDIVILFPEGRVSEVQRRQMTTYTDANVHPLAVKGTFDDCQRIVKTLFVDASFKQRHRLVAVNSINWARIAAQIVYYFYAGLRLGAPHRASAFCVPTGNFGDIYAGYLAAKMGLPVADLAIATNRNDILSRCLSTGTYDMREVTPSLSPSMDIQISSNFERLLFDLYGNDSAAIHSLMETLKQSGQFTLHNTAHEQLKLRFSAGSADDAATLAAIASTYEKSGYVLDPHTAVGVHVARTLTRRIPKAPLVTLATAHPAKFPDAVKKATGIHPALPAHLADLFDRKEKMAALPNDPEAVKTFIDDIAQ